MTLSAATSTVQTLLAFDFGQKRIGVAVGNSLTGAARPLATLTEQTTDGRFARIPTLLKEWQPTGLVVGRPLHPDGTPHEVTALAERFARRLEGRFGLPVFLVDERYSSVAAQERMRDEDDEHVTRGGRRRKGGASQGDDATAAAIILEQYLSETRS